MMKRLFMAVAMMGASASLFAQSVKIAGELQGDLPADLKLYVMPVGDAWVKPDEVSMDGKSYQVQTTASPYHIYKLVGVANQRQVIVPFHLETKAAPNQDATAQLDLTMKGAGDLDLLHADADTKALMAFNDLNVERSKQMWMQGKEMEAGKLKGLVMGYVTSADSLVKVYHPTSSTAQYLRLWASTLTFESMESLKFATGRTAESLDIDVKAETAKLVASVDNEMSSAFDSSPRLVLATIPEGSLADRIASIEQKVKTDSLKARAEGVLLSQFISSFDYNNKYEEGLKELTALTERFQLDEKYLGEFKVRKSSIAGTPFPADVVLTDLQGKKVDFAKYRGKYVFIDLWASWCIPCIKEIPHLKQLEKELQNKDVVFLSISIDTNVAAWKKKVAALDLEGELLINKDNKLGEVLNVSGIPFFLIYDKEGKLYKYNAYRPSDVRLKPLLEGLK